jgi:K+-transporting ATPase A subunit
MTSSIAANSQDAEMADTMRSNGKIYVVVAIILIVLVGLITYLFLLDRKVDKLEKQLNNKD